MANIEILELPPTETELPAGTKLLFDSESYMEEISELELNSLKVSGGATPGVVATIVSLATILIPGNTF